MSNETTTSIDSNDEPNWLDQAYVKRILDTYTNNELHTVHSYTKTLATAKGENYASTMHLINAAYSVKSEPDAPVNLSMIVKSRLDNELLAQIEQDFNVFERESQMYTRIMPAASKLLRSLNDETIFGPRTFYVDERIIVLENLKLLGYSIADVKQGLSLDHCRLIVTKLAKFHAVNMVLYKQSPELYCHHLPGNISENPSPLHEFYTHAIKACIDYCRSNPKLSLYVHKLEEFGLHIIPNMINVFSRNQTDRYHVLTCNHGDVWVNNLMFRHGENGSPLDIIFVDYQEGFFGSPGIDWNYFIFSSWQLDVFQNHFDELVQIYHRTLTEILVGLKHDERIPTLEDVQREILSKSFHGLATATCLLPILINEHASLADPENFILETDEAFENRRVIFSNPKYGERLEVFLAYFVKNRIL